MGQDDISNVELPTVTDPKTGKVVGYAYQDGDGQWRVQKTDENGQNESKGKERQSQGGDRLTANEAYGTIDALMERSQLPSSGKEYREKLSAFVDEIANSNDLTKEEKSALLNHIAEKAKEASEEQVKLSQGRSGTIESYARAGEDFYTIADKARKADPNHQQAPGAEHTATIGGAQVDLMSTGSQGRNEEDTGRYKPNGQATPGGASTEQGSQIALMSTGAPNRDYTPKTYQSEDHRPAPGEQYKPPQTPGQAPSRAGGITMM